jgi:dolichol kinase|eukprot:SAG25_NODE_677_length_5979_cov_2.486395_3_plen_73_part_00
MAKGKTLAGSCAFMFVTSAWFWGRCEEGVPTALVKGFVLAAVEHQSGGLDNLVLPIATIALNRVIAIASGVE